MSSSSNAALVIPPVLQNMGGSEAPPARRARVLRGVTATTVALSVLDARSPASAAQEAEALAQEAERGYTEGFARGYEDGLTEGRSAMAAEVDAARSRLASAARALTGAAGDLGRRQALEVAGLEDVVAGLAFEIATAVVGRELTFTGSAAARDALARALALAPPAQSAVARFHPDDVAVMEIAIPLDRPVTVIADPNVEPGGCVLEVGDCRIDAQVGPALDRVRLALLGDAVVSNL